MTNLKTIACLGALLSFPALAEDNDKYLMGGDQLEFTRKMTFVNKSKFQAESITVQGKIVKRGPSNWMRCEMEKTVDANTTVNVMPGRKLKQKYESHGETTAYRIELEGDITIRCSSDITPDPDLEFDSVYFEIRDLEACLPVKVKRPPPADHREEEL
jgi:hypothetical protein